MGTRRKRNTIKELTLREHNQFYGAKPNKGKFHEIRINARRVMKDNNIEYCCKVCGYKTYVEVCHLKSIADFDLSTKIKDINSLDNLAYLCPNHHKELDRGLLPLSAVTGTNL